MLVLAYFVIGLLLAIPLSYRYAWRETLAYRRRYYGALDIPEHITAGDWWRTPFPFLLSISLLLVWPLVMVGFIVRHTPIPKVLTGPPKDIRKLIEEKREREELADTSTGLEHLL